MLKQLAVMVLLAALAACQVPTPPRVPDDSTRVPVNQTLPSELQ